MLKDFLINQGVEYPYDFHRALYKKQWVVFCNQPVKGAKQTIKYLSIYTHKIAISNHRILTLDDKFVTFRYKDYRHGGKYKQLSLDKDEFIRRFSIHILPRGFTRIRHYGILSGKLKSKLITKPKQTKNEMSWEKFWLDRGVDVYQCPHCKKGRLVLIGEIPKRGLPILSHSSITHI